MEPRSESASRERQSDLRMTSRRKVLAIFLCAGLVILLFAFCIPAVQANLANLESKKDIFAPSTVPAASSGSPQSKYFALVIQVKAGDAGAAYSTLQSMTPEQQADPLVQDQLAELLFRTGQFVQAAKVWVRIGNLNRVQTLARQALEAGEYPESIELNRVVFNARPDLVWVDLATAYQRAGDFAEAELVLSYLIEHRPAIPASQKLNWELDLANLQKSQANWGKAAALYSRIFQEFPDSLEACQGLGQSQVRTGDVDNSIATFKKCLALSPGKEDVVLVYAGKAFEEVGNKPIANAYYEQALTVNPKNSDAAAGLGRVK